ncbi:MAG: lysophospholipid acyltransferase family protein [Limisphaerales bacterium]|jgi:1-acyl-sn-glycerol-3-phosphate acyltransferase
MNAVQRMDDAKCGKGDRPLTVPDFRRLSLSATWKYPLPYLPLIDRFVIKWLVLFFQRMTLGITGLEQIQPERDPFILAMNHNQKPEAIAISALLFFYRGGKKIHFFSDWNFQLIPFVSYVIRRSEVITLTRKSAKPKFLNVFKPWFELSEPPFDVAKKKLAAGASVGVYPEGTVNRHPKRLLRGYPGMARLSIESGCPVVPIGISFPNLPEGKEISDWEPMQISIGAPMHPPVVEEVAKLEDARDWHAEIMTEISKLSGKEWCGNSLRK